MYPEFYSTSVGIPHGVPFFVIAKRDQGGVSRRRFIAGYTEDLYFLNPRQMVVFSWKHRIDPLANTKNDIIFRRMIINRLGEKAIIIDTRMHPDPEIHLQIQNGQLVCVDRTHPRPVPEASFRYHQSMWSSEQARLARGLRLTSSR